jgi:peptidoglycan/xylan/chitin deacetylase (PgdA/CDA1 family)
LDLDGVTDIYRVRGWAYQYPDDPVFESGVRNALDLFRANGVRATFFVIADSLDRPDKRKLLLEIVRAGHEVASHTVTHLNLLEMSTADRRREIVDSRRLIEDRLGAEIRGFRAPGCQIDRGCLELVAEAGYEYDSSAFPTPTFARRLGVNVTNLEQPSRLLPDRGLLELPLPDFRPLPFPYHASYSQLLGLSYFRVGLTRARRRPTPLVLLFHLIDVADPLPADRLPGWEARLLTLSLFSARRKIRRCQKILDIARKHYRFTTTSALAHARVDTAS